jgi:hypothetical protein
MTLLERVNEKYAELVLGPDFAYRAPEARPQVQSRSLLALIAVLEEVGTEAKETLEKILADAAPDPDA